MSDVRHVRHAELVAAIRSIDTIESALKVIFALDAVIIDASSRRFAADQEIARLRAEIARARAATRSPR